METLDATHVVNRAIRLGLLSREQADEGWGELGDRKGEPEAFLRVMERRGYLTPFQTQKLLKNDHEGYFLGGYRLLYKIASGSFGRVFRADDPTTGRVYAIKVLRKKWSEDRHTIELFEREGRVGVSLKHPNIVEILAVNKDQATKQYYMVLEFVEGGTLRDFLRIRKKLDAVEAVKIIEDAAAALSFAFLKGITHRDMKTTNVLISSTGVAKLVDFGLADVVDRTSTKASPSDENVDVDRTVDYAGLERATGAPHGDTRSDIFFLGCIAYHLLTGRSPIEWSKKPTDRMQKERFLNIPPMRPDEVNAPASVFRLVDSMMKLNPDERFQTPNQVLEAIRTVRRDLGIAAPCDGKTDSTQTYSIFLIEKDERLQDLLRKKLREKGFKVLIANNPQRALERYRQTPFDLFVVHAPSATDDAIPVFDSLMRDARRQNCPMGGILILPADQAGRDPGYQEFPNVHVMYQPVKYKELLGKIREATEKLKPG
ncbi:MAG: serine/threonine-protein kinase [Planctomycetota bacterium]